MPKLSVRPPRDDGTVMYLFFCPGCKEMHSFLVGGPPNTHPRWSFNGDFERPTFAPSLRYTDGSCHLFLEVGRIRFLNDCTHELAGQTVDLPEIPPEWDWSTTRG